MQKSKSESKFCEIYKIEYLIGLEVGYRPLQNVLISILNDYAKKLAHFWALQKVITPSDHSKTKCAKRLKTL